MKRNAMALLLALLFLCGCAGQAGSASSAEPSPPCYRSPYAGAHARANPGAHSGPVPLAGQLV